MIYKLDEEAFKNFKTDGICVLTSFVLDSSAINTYDKYFFMFIKSLVVTNNNNKISVLIIYNKESSIYIKYTLLSFKEAISKSNIDIYLIENIIFDHLIKNMDVYGEFSRAIVYRLLTPFLFPQVNKILWLDIDTMICDSLVPLYNKDISDYSFAGTKDIDHMRDISYINSGVLLMNSVKIRDKYKTVENLIDTYINFKCSTDQQFIVRDNDFLLSEDITYNYPGFFNRLVLPFIDNPIYKNKLVKLAKETKIFHFYPKYEYTIYGQIIDIMKDNNQVFNECVYWI